MKIMKSEVYPRTDQVPNWGWCFCWIFGIGFQFNDWSADQDIDDADG